MEALSTEHFASPLTLCTLEALLYVIFLTCLWNKLTVNVESEGVYGATI